MYKKNLNLVFCIRILNKSPKLQSLKKLYDKLPNSRLEGLGHSRFILHGIKKCETLFSAPETTSLKIFGIIGRLEVFVLICRNITVTKLTLYNKLYNNELTNYFLRLKIFLI